MSSAPHEQELFAHPSPNPGTVFVNDHVCVQTEEDQRVISVHGVVFSHYSIKDRTAEAYAMVLLFESGYANQNDIARCFGYSARSLRRYQERLRTGGLGALSRPRGRPSGHKKSQKRDQTILRLKTKGMSNRWIAGRLASAKRLSGKVFVGGAGNLILILNQISPSCRKPIRKQSGTWLR
jgi:transposase